LVIAPYASYPYDAVRKVVLKPQAAGPVAIWDGEPKRLSVEHDTVHDEP